MFKTAAPKILERPSDLKIQRFKSFEEKKSPNIAENKPAATLLNQGKTAQTQEKLSDVLKNLKKQKDLIIPSEPETGPTVF